MHDSLDYGGNFAHMLGFDNPKMHELMRLYLTIHRYIVWQESHLLDVVIVVCVTMLQFKCSYNFFLLNDFTAVIMKVGMSVLTLPTL